MEISPLRFLRMLIAAFLFGVSVGIWQDVGKGVRLFSGIEQPDQRLEGLYRVRLPLANRTAAVKGRRTVLRALVQFVKDVSTFLYFAVGMILLGYRYNDGRFRILPFFIALLGMIFYIKTAGRFSSLLLSFFAFLIRALIFCVFALFLRPFLFFGHFLRKNVHFLQVKFQKALEKKHMKVYNKKRKEFLRAGAEKGFLCEGVFLDFEDKGER